MPQATSPHGIVLFDGTCAFCVRSVSFIARRDHAGFFTFGASQNPAGQAVLAQFGETRESTRSIILIEDGQLHRKSTAVLRIARRLPLPWSLAALFLAVPRPVRDAAYGVVAAVRHRLAGRSNACEIPPPEIRDRLIGER
jgi:predicted DCC family thiol-disulfide oxidoreductase YuxK